jgi:ADP-ribose pyrophosphatase YjhB (NUDIX family)
MIAPPRSINHIKNSHCSYCGSRFAEQITYPRRCWTCHNDSYANPLPVTVALIKVWGGDKDPHKAGILIQNRNIEPKKGCWALPGGYMNLGETWQDGCAREIKEEMGLITEPEGYNTIGVAMGNNNNTILIFTSYQSPVYWDEIKFSPNEEVTDIRLAYVPEELAFPTHTQYLTNELTSYYGS